MKQQTAIQIEQTKIQSNQEQIASKQMEIDKSQYLPKLKIRFTAMNVDKRPEIVITNYGTGPLYDGSYDVHTFLVLREFDVLDVKSGKRIGKSRFREVKVPIDGIFLGIEYRTDAFTSDLARIPQMDIIRLEAAEAAWEKIHKDAGEDVDHYYERYVTATYRNQFDEVKTETYRVDQVSQTLIPDKDWAKRLNEYEVAAKSHTILNADDVTTEQLQAVWNPAH